MKVICNRGALLEALLLAGSAVVTRTPKPVIQCVKLEAKDNELTVSATDMELSIRCRDSQVQVEAPGETLVMAERLSAIVRESIDDTLSIEVEGESATIKGQDSKFKLFTQPTDAFPPIPDYEGDADFTVSGGLIRSLINQTIFAAAKASTRYAFHGVMFNAKGKHLTLVSTDAHRLALARGELTGPVAGKEMLKAIVPVKALQIVEKLVSNPEDPVQFQLRENQIIAHTPSATLTSTLIEGQFPPYEDVIPKESNRKMTASRADLLSAVRRTALMATEESKGIRMAFSKSGLVISGSSHDAGEAVVNFPCKFDGDDLEIGFNPSYFIDVLKVVNADEVTLELSAFNRPAVLKAGPDFLYVIMPVQLP